ncbi:helix-turn-helix domain-containing protein [Nocardia sp. NPDC049707]|uniref:PucR family transcriptional regulator n=1 Tax=Nocardia sp. NPDC049707 TaxID=3154735 RepID=UPI00342A4501
MPLSIDQEARSSLGAGALDWAHALAEEIARDFIENTIPELADTTDFAKALARSAEVNVLRILLALDGSPADGDPPIEALNFVRDAALRHVPLWAILRGYRLGLDHWIRWAAPAIESHSASTDRLDDFREATQAAVRHIDQLSEAVVTEYEREMNRRASVGAARRLALLRAVLAGDKVDVDAGSRTLDYPLHGHHIAVVFSLAEDTSALDPLALLESEARALAARAHALAVTTAPAGRRRLHAWLAVPTDRALTGPLSDGVEAGYGSAGVGVAGFRRSHAEAFQALEVLQASSPTAPNERIVAYADVRLVALVAAEKARARLFLASVLGGLAGSDPRSRELRTTLYAFLARNRSHTATARDLHLHKNTVVKRVARAYELVGDDAAKREIDLHVALTVLEILGDDLLDPAEQIR